MYGARIGIGREKKSHIHLNFAHAWDDSSSIPSYKGAIPDNGEKDTVELASPIENSVFSLEGNLVIMKGKLEFDGEIALAAYNRDMRSNTVEVDQLDWLPSAVFQPRMTSQVDWAAQSEASLNLSSTQLNFAFKQVGWGFEAVTVPFIDQDTRKWEISFNQSFSGPIPMNLSISGQLCRDNLDGMKSVTTKTRRGTFNLGLYPSNYPSMTIGYSPHHMSAPEDSVMKVNKLDRTTHSLWGSSSYNFQIGEQQQNVSANFSENITRTSVENEVNYNWNLNFNGSHGITDILTGNWNIGINQQVYDSSSGYLSSGAGIDFKLWEGKLQNSLNNSYQYALNGQDNKFIVKLTNELELFKNFSLEISNEYAAYNSDDDEEDYTEYIARADVSYNW